MTPKKYERLVLQQTVSAQKVFASVPAEQIWTAGRIYEDMSKRGISMPFNIVEGCLKALTEEGLVRESKLGFTRLPMRQAEPAKVDKPVKTSPSDRLPAAEPAVEVREETVMDKLTSLAGELRRLSDQMELMASKVEEIAVGVDDDIKKLSGASDTLRKFKELFKDV